MNDTPTEQPVDFLELTTEVIAAYVSNNPVPSGDLSKLIAQTHAALCALSDPPMQAPAEKPVPAVPVRKSVSPNYLVCLEDGKKFKSLKRHLATHYNLTPQQYREKWELPADYPMVAPSYSERRSSLAKAHGLGRKTEAAVEPAKSARKKVGLRL